MKKVMTDKILSFIEEGIVTTNEDFVIISFNPAFEKFFSVAFSKTKSKKEKIIEVVSFPKMNTAFEFAESGGVFSEESPVYFRGKRVECKVTVFKEGNVTNWIFEDITNFKILEDAKSDFVSAVSHEFMTPLSVVDGFLSIIRDPDIAKKLRDDYIDRSIVQLKRLEKLVDQLLSLSELEMKKYVPNFSTVNILQMLFEVKDEMAYRWKAKSVKVRIDSSKDFFIYTEGSALYRILANLLSNSIKYSHKNGEVTIKVMNEKGKVKISIEDNGIGIKEEEIPRIFERFYRASNSSETGAKGMGLGLALVKHLCEVIEAKMEVYSRYTLGSIFTIVLSQERR